MERGLTMSDVRRMTIGAVVDFSIAYNDRQEQARKAEERREKQKDKPKKRKATQADINAFFG